MLRLDTGGHTLTDLVGSLPEGVTVHAYQVYLNCLGTIAICWRSMSQTSASIPLSGGREGTVGDAAKLGVLTVSDRASVGVYDDLSGPAILQFLEAAVASPWTADYRVIPDEQAQIEQAIIDMVRAWMDGRLTRTRMKQAWHTCVALQPHNLLPRTQLNPGHNAAACYRSLVKTSCLPGPFTYACPCPAAGEAENTGTHHCKACKH